MATITEIDHEDVEELSMDVSELEKQLNVPVLITLTGSECSNYKMIRANAYAALNADYPMGPSGALALIDPRLYVVRYRIKKLIAEEIDGAGAITTARCYGYVYYSTHSARRTRWWFSGAGRQITTRYDAAGTEIPTGETCQRPAGATEFHYERYEAAIDWGPQAGGMPSATGSMRQRAMYCQNRINQVAFLDCNSDTIFMHPFQMTDLENGDKLLHYTFSFMNEEYEDGKYERDGYFIDSAGTAHRIVGRAAFSSIMQLYWPTEDGGGPL